MKKTNYLLLLFLIALCFVGCKKVKNMDKEFEELEENLFFELIGTDPLNVNNMVYDPDALGITLSEVKAVEYTMEDENEYFNSWKDLKEQMESFNNNSLSKKNRLTKEIVLSRAKTILAAEGLYYYGTNLGSYLGDQVQYPLVLAEYKFHKERDIINYLEYLKIMGSIFDSYIKFEKEKIDNGYGVEKSILEGTLDQIKEFLSYEECFLIPVFNDKINKLEYINAVQKESYINTHNDYINEYFLQAYKDLYDDVSELIKIEENNPTYNEFVKEKQKEYYTYLLQDAIGTTKTPEEVLSYILDKFNSAYNNFRNEGLSGSKRYNDYMSGTGLMNGQKLADLIPYFKGQCKELFPSLEMELVYDLLPINESQEDFSSPAMYFISPIDSNDSVEKIYYNKNSIGQPDNYTYQTIAHEGYPGHMYQHRYLVETDLSNLRKILNFMGYTEGWATYVEQYVTRFKYNNSETASIFFGDANAIVTLLCSAVDIYINYYDWDFERVCSFLKNYLNVNNDDCKNIYNQMKEVPTNFLQYYYSYYRILDMKKDFKKKMKDKYSELLFHTIFLETGPVPLEILENQYVSYK